MTDDLLVLMSPPRTPRALAAWSEDELFYVKYECAVAEENRRRYIEQSAATVAGKLAPLPH